MVRCVVDCCGGERKKGTKSRRTRMRCGLAISLGLFNSVANVTSASQC